MKKIKQKLIRTSESGLFHDSRKDVRLISQVVNNLIDTVNELIDENEKLKKLISETTTESK
jgi:hypothetical protein